MPDKFRRRGSKIKRHHREPVSVEDKIRAEYNAERRSTWWWGNERGHWPGIWMTLAKKYEMPIAAIKNIVRKGGISDRPLPPPLTESQIRERQEKRGDFLVEQYHERYAGEFSQAIRDDWRAKQTDWYISRQWNGYKEWRHNSYKGWGIVENWNGIQVYENHHVVYDADSIVEAKYWAETH